MNYRISPRPRHLKNAADAAAIAVMRQSTPSQAPPPQENAEAIR
jgi:hypothetical protein